MGLHRQVEIYPLYPVIEGSTEFYTPQLSDETVVLTLAPYSVEDLFVHRYQTDQLLVVRGKAVVVILQNRRYRYLPLSAGLASHQQDPPKIVKIPPGVPHSAVNLSSEPCVMVNALLRHGPAHKWDYRPLKPPLPYDLDYIRQCFDRVLPPLAIA
jgi:mannose-6-phosphate isomerase-like protein (cupin superfamily)